MARGTLVGDAYVRLLVDGTFLHDAVKKELAKSGEDVDKEGNKLGEDFGKAIKAGATSEVAKFNRDLANSLGSNEQSFDRFRKAGESVDDTMEGLIDRVQHFSQQQRINKDDTDKSIAAIERWGASVKAVELDKFNQEMGKVHDSAVKMNDAFDAKKMKEFEVAAAAVVKQMHAERDAARDMAIEQEGVQRAFDIKKEKDHSEALKVHTKRYEDMVEEIGRLSPALSKLIEPMDKIEASTDKVSRKQQILNKVFRDGDGAAKYSAETLLNIARGMDRTGSRADSFGKKIDGVGDKIGKAFGAGARNNFVNLIGVMAGGLANAGESLLKTFASMSDEVKNFFSTFNLAKGEGLGNFDAIKVAASGLSESFAGLAAAGPAGLAVVAGLSVLIPAAVSGIALLAGGIVAVAGAIAYGLAGALLPLFPIVAALGVGLVVLAQGFKALGKTTDKVASQDFKTFKDALTGFQKVDFVRPLAKALAGLAPVITQSIVPAFKNMGGAIVDVIGGFGKALSSGPMKQFLAVWAVSLPNIFRSFGAGLTNLLTGIIAFFTPILPYAQKLADGFKSITDQFSKWASSAGGQNAIADFMKDAWARAGELVDVIKEVGRFIGLVFEGGQEAGGSFLTTLTDLFKGWNDFLSTKDGQAAMKQFFSDAKDFGKKLWDVLLQLGSAFGDMVTPQSISDIKGFVSALGTIAGVINGVVAVFNFFGEVSNALWSGLITGVVAAFSGINSAVQGGQVAWAGLADAVGSFYNGAILPVVQGIRQAFAEVVDIIAGVFRALGKVPGFEWATTAANSMDSFATSIRKSSDELEKMPTDNVVKVKFDNDVLEKVPALDRKLDALNKKTITIKSKDEVTAGLKEAEATLARLKGKDVPVSLKGEANKQADILQGKINTLKGKALQIELKESGIDIGAISGKLDGLKGKTIDVKTSGNAVKDIEAAQAAIALLRGKDIPVELRGAALAKADEIEAKIVGLKGKDIPISATDKTGAGTGSAQGKLNGLIDKSVTIQAKNETAKGIAESGIMLAGVKDHTASIFAANKTASSVAIAQKTIGGVLDKTASIFAANKTGPGVASGKATVNSLPNKTASLYAANKTGPGVSSGKGTIATLPNKTASLYAANKTGAGVGSAKGTIASVPNKNASIFASNKTYPGVSSAQGSINSVTGKTVTLTVDVISNVRSAIANVMGAIASIGAKASGGILRRPEIILAGEDGPEAIVPLNRPLSQVDPAVRMLSAIAQGKAKPPTMGSMAMPSTGTTIEAGAIVVQGSLNPVRTAEAVIDRMVLSGYLG